MNLTPVETRTPAEVALAAHGRAGAAAGVPVAAKASACWSRAARRPRPGRWSCCSPRAPHVDVYAAEPSRRTARRRRARRSAAPSRSIAATGAPPTASARPSRSARSRTTREAARFAGAARAAGASVNVIDKPKFCDFNFGAIVNRSPLVIGISTDGASPIFGQAIRAKLEAMIPRGFARWVEAARRWRAQRAGLGPVVQRPPPLLAASHQRRGAPPGPRAGRRRFRRGCWRRRGRRAPRSSRAR